MNENITGILSYQIMNLPTSSNLRNSKWQTWSWITSEICGDHSHLMSNQLRKLALKCIMWSSSKVKVYIGQTEHRQKPKFTLDKLNITWHKTGTNM